MNIPVFKPYLDSQEIHAAVAALELGWLGPGSYVKEFEHGIAKILGVSPELVVAVNTGTSAVHLALKLCGVGFGDEVITPSFNNIADFQSIKMLGAEPVFCDVKESDLTIDPYKFENLITTKTKAIICLDYGSALCEYSKIKDIADKYCIPVLYDAAHSFGSNRADGSMIGSEADFCAFSFDPVKNITCIDGGAIIFKDKNLANKAKYMRLLGQKQNQDHLYTNSRSWTYDVDDIGYRYHLANLHAAIGVEQLAKLKTIKITRQKIFNSYYSELSKISGLLLPPIVADGIVPFIFVLRILDKKRLEFREYLSTHGIDTGIHWQAGHKFSYFAKAKCNDLSITNKISEEIVTLPLYPELTQENIAKIIATIKSFFGANTL